MNRRDNLILLGGAATLAVGVWASREKVEPPPSSAAPFKLPPLGYPNDALEPHIDATTMMIHHDKHHAAYVANANALAGKWPDLATIPMETILADLSKAPEAVRAGVRDNVGGHWNHTFFWELMTPGGAKAPSGDLAAAIDAMGGLAALTDKVNAAGLARFGAGWAWLVVDKDKKLAIISTANQDTPLERGARPILGVDVWEHAYYLKYQNRRADYLKGWWNVVDWDKAAGNFRRATS
jgi:superoxide dismutase, Fe-Mn family